MDKINFELAQIDSKAQMGPDSDFNIEAELILALCK